MYDVLYLSICNVFVFYLSICNVFMYDVLYLSIL